MERKYQLIRGQRILNLLNEEATYAELERNTMQFTPPTKKRQFAVNAVNIQNLETVPAPQSGTLEIRATAQSGANQYQPIMLFSDVEFQEEDSPENVTFTGADSQEYHMMPISLTNHNVKVRCTCLDFRWRFSMYNQKTNSLYGPGPELYQKKTQRPPNNPQGVPGLCKHLLALAIELKNNRLVVQ